MRGRTYVQRFERAVPTRWDVMTDEVNNAAAAWARGPNGRWEVQLARNDQLDTKFAYNVELYRLDPDGASKGLHQGTTVRSPGAVTGAVRRMIEEVTGGDYRSGRRGVPRQPRRGEVDDKAGLLGDLF